MEEEKKSYGYSYDLPEDRDAFIDTGKGEVVEKEELTPFQMIKAVAKQNNYEVRDPKSGCRSCYGRGYIGKDAATEMPIPCKCIFPPQTQVEKENDQLKDRMFGQAKPNRQQKRAMERFYRKQLNKSKGKLLKYIREQKAKIASTSGMNTAPDEMVGVNSVNDNNTIETEI